MIRRVLDAIRSCLGRGRILNRDLPEEIREAEGNLDRVKIIREDAGRYLRDVGRLLNILALVAAGLLLIVIGLLVAHVWLGLFEKIYLLLVSSLTLLALTIVWPAFGLVPHLKKLPGDIYKELLWPVWVSTEIVNIAASIGLLLYVFSGWRISESYTILVFLAFLWLCVPWAIYFLFQASAFVFLRIAQLTVLILAALFCVFSPVPMSQFQWVANRDLANRVRPVEQQEITDSWRTLQWFTQEGAPNVWFSFNPTRGYHLYSAPGYDPQTDEALKPVGEVATRNVIVKSFLDAVAAQERKESDEKARTLKLEQDQAIAAAEKAAADQVSEFVYPSMSGTKHELVLVALAADGKESAELSLECSALLNNDGLKCENNVFTPAFIASDVFQNLLSSSRDAAQSFHPGNYVSYLLVVASTPSIESHQQVAGVDMLATELTWKISLLAVGDCRVVKVWKFTERGSGFNNDDSVKMATERMKHHFRSLATEVSTIISQSS